jgi:hypothetical protein
MDKCNSTQVYDTYLKTCISCRDPTVLPIVRTPNNSRFKTKINSDGSPYNIVDSNDVISGPAKYQCHNKPIKTYDTDMKVINYTCDSGETLIDSRIISRATDLRQAVTADNQTIVNDDSSLDYGPDDDVRCTINFFGKK